MLSPTMTPTALVGGRDMVAISDVNVVMTLLISYENQELSFTKVKLKVVFLHPCRYVRETV